MKKLLTKIAGLFAVFALLIGLGGCFESSYSSSSMKSGLEKAGYKVDENPVIVNLDTSKLEGYKSSLYGYKTVDGTEDAILILIFDSIANVEKATASNVSSSGDKVANDFVTIMYRWGRNHAPETDTLVYGTANNIVWAGSSEAKKAAGIQ